MLNQAEQRIGFIHGFIDDPDGLCVEDWKIWRPLIAKACVQVMNENFRKMGIEAMYFFNHHFYTKKHMQENKKTNVL